MLIISAGMFSTRMSVLMLMMGTFHIRIIVQISGQICCNRIICITGYSAIKFYSSFFECTLCASANATAD